MLYKDTLENSTLELIKRMCEQDFLKTFFLVGGTALSLQIGHRKSIDIDFFSQDSFDVKKMEENLSSVFSFKELYIENNTIKGIIEGVFVDVIKHKYPLVNPLINRDNIRMLSLEDIAAMKLNAIIGNGQRLKDFADIAFLLSYLSLNQMIVAYSKKYSYANQIIVLKALLFYEDIDFNVELDLMNRKFKWEKFKKRIEDACKHPDKVFPAL